MNMLTLDELRAFARNPHPNLPLIIIQDENGHILKQDESPVRTSRGRQAIALADVTYMDARQSNRSVKSHHHPYPFSNNVSSESRPSTSIRQLMHGGNTKTKATSTSSSSSPPSKHRFAQSNVKYNFDDIGGAVPQMSSERESRSNVATRKAAKTHKLVKAIFAEEIKKESKSVSTRKTSGNGGIQFGWT